MPWFARFWFFLQRFEDFRVLLRLRVSRGFYVGVFGPEVHFFLEVGPLWSIRPCRAFFGFNFPELRGLD